MSGVIATIPKFQFSANGVPMVNGALETYLAGTSTPATTWQDQALSIANTNPITLDSRGECVLWLDSTKAYKFILKNAGGVVQWTQDNVSGAASLHGLAASDGSAQIGYAPAGTGAVATTVQAKQRETVSVFDFMTAAQIADVQSGAATLDVTAAIQAALNTCNTFVLGETKPKLIGCTGTYKVTGTLTISCDCDLSSMLIVADGASVSPVIRVGGTASDQITWFKKISLPKVRNSSRVAGQWGSGTGVQATNCNACEITIPAIQYFSVGADFAGYSQGFAYNTINLRYIYDNKVNIRLKPIDAAGWTNQNAFVGGRLGFTPSLFSGTTNVGSRNILLEQWDTTLLQAGGPNSNSFINTSIEGDTFPEYSIDIQGSFNIFQGCRYEGAAAKNVRLFSQAISGTHSNLFIGGYQAYGLTVTKQGAGTSVNNSLISGRSNRISANGAAFSITVGGGSSPHIQGFRASQDAIEKTISSTDWTYRIYESTAEFKSDTDTYARSLIDYGSGNFYFSNGTIASPTSYIGPYGTSAIRCSATFQPVVDNTTGLGAASFRWSVLYAGTGTINTSDLREKQGIQALDAAEMRVAATLRGLIRKFRFRDAVQEKGDAARIHVGVIAQDVMAAFQAEGLDPMCYGIVCYDEWGAEAEELDAEGNVTKPALEAGNRYGVRYEELLAFIIAAI